MVSHEIPEKIFFMKKFKIKEEKREKESKSKKLYIKAGTNIEESNFYKTIQTENFSPKQVYILPKIQFITHFNTPKRKLKLSLEKKKIL